MLKGPTNVVTLDRTPTPCDESSDIAKVWHDTLKQDRSGSNSWRKGVDREVVEDPCEGGRNHRGTFCRFQCLVTQDHKNGRREIAIYKLLAFRLGKIRRNTHSR